MYFSCGVCLISCVFLGPRSQQYKIRTRGRNRTIWCVAGNVGFHILPYIIYQLEIKIKTHIYTYISNFQNRILSPRKLITQGFILRYFFFFSNGNFKMFHEIHVSPCFHSHQLLKLPLIVAELRIDFKS